MAAEQCDWRIARLRYIPARLTMLDPYLTLMRESKELIKLRLHFIIGTIEYSNVRVLARVDAHRRI